MNRARNGGTQPHRPQPVFDNWDVVARAWYLLCPSAEVKRGQVRAYELCGQRLAVFRGEDGVARAVDAYCPHMGADLANGKVIGNTLQCFFHQWRFDGTGRCVAIPCSDRIPAGARLQGYATAEKYGFMWVWPEAEAPGDVPEYPELAGQPVWHQAGEPVHHPCHHHVCMINGIDVQHLRTVHRIEIDMSVEASEEASGRVVDYYIAGEWTDRTATERMARRLLGPRYGYRMRYVDASVGLLTTLLDTRLLGRGPALPALRMIFGFTPLAPGKTRVWPIFIAPKRPGAAHWLAARAMLAAQRLGYARLDDEDADVYDNIRFQAGALLPVDGPVAKYISYVNRLPLSRWSTTNRYDHLAPGKPVPLRRVR